MALTWNNYKSTILKEIYEERKKQDDKWGEQNHPITGESPWFARNQCNELREQCEARFMAGDGDWNDILQEEVWEALADAAEGNMKGCRKELIQVAAVVVAMIENIDREEAKQQCLPLT